MVDFRKVFADLDGATFKTGAEYRAAVKEACRPYMKELPYDTCFDDLAETLQRLGWVRRAGGTIELQIPLLGSREF